MSASLVGSEMCIRDRMTASCVIVVVVAHAVVLALTVMIAVDAALLSLIHIWTLPTICSV
eukprot:8878414-Alexandrium_andersonii.AAC.1